MKLSFLFCFGCCLHLSAATFGQGITLTVNGAQLETVMKSIQDQSAYRFVFTREQLKDTKPLTFSVQEAPIEQILDLCAKGQPIFFTREENYVIVKMREVTAPPKLEQLRIDVTGTIRNEKGEAIEGATVASRDGSVSTTSDSKGWFVLKGVEAGSIVRVSSIGYETVEIKTVPTPLVIILSVKINTLDETVVKGYYNTSRRLNTGAVSSVEAETLERQPVSNVLAALSGQMPGVSVIQNTGVAGGSFNVEIRGRNSLRADGNNPLYIVDGVPYSSTPYTSLYSSIIDRGSPLNNIDIADIENVVVLKDADATAIYGSRGANGVVLITTKKGKAGKTSLDCNIYVGAGKTSRRMNLLNTQQYLAMRKEAYRNDGMLPKPWHSDVVAWDSTRYTDWQDALTGGTASIANAQLALSGGSPQTQFNMRGGVYRESTVFPGDFRYLKKSIHLGLNHSSINKKFKINLSVAYLADDNRLPQIDLTAKSLMTPPNAPAGYDENGQLNWGPGTFDNPYAYLQQEFKMNSSSIIGSLQASYQLFSSLQIRVNTGFTDLHSHEISKTPTTFYNPMYAVQTGEALFSDSRVKTWVLEPQLHFQHAISRGMLSVLAGMSFQEDIRETLSQSGTGFSSDALLENRQAATVLSTNASDYSQYRYNAFFGRIAYDWQQKYIINFTGRRDGSSRFGPDHQFGNFGSVGAAWIFSAEPFVQRSGLFSFGKLRASYGTTGSDQIPDYGYTSTYTATPYPYQVGGLIPVGLMNPDFAWETNQKLETALELGFIKDRLLLTVSYYRNRSSNQLVGYALPLITGFSAVQNNLPATVQNTGWEFELHTTNVKTTRLKWTSSFNLSAPRNELLAYPNIEGSAYANVYEVGKSLYTVKAIHVIGVQPQTGVYLFEDANHSGNIDIPGDLQTQKAVARTLYGGFDNQLVYGNAELDFFFQFVQQTGFSYLKGFGMPGSGVNQPLSVLKRWQHPGDITPVQRFSQNFAGSSYTAFQRAQSYGDGGIGDASFLRLKNVSMSYRLPGLAHRLHAQSLRLYLQGQNLLTWTSYEGLDPESQSVIKLPALRIYSLGIQLTL